MDELLVGRRSLLAAALSLGLLPGCLSGPPRARSSDAVTACRNLFLYGLPVLEMARARDRTLGPRPNVFRHVRRLASAASRHVTTPNADTLYSSAWIDLRAGAVEVDVPVTGDRYFSLAFLDMFSNNFYVLSPRAASGNVHKVILVPPDVMPGKGEVRAPTWWVWAQARTLVLSEHDLPGAHAVQDTLSIAGPAGRAPDPAAAREAPAYAQLADILRLLETEAPPAQADGPFVASWTSAGLSRTALAAPGAALMYAAEEGLLAARMDIDRIIDGAGSEEGWIYPRPAIGDFGTDYLYRASIASWGLGALPSTEAMYMRASGVQDKATFDGRAAYRISFPAGGTPPVEAFWSLSLYEALPSGELFFFDNPFQKFMIGDRTAGLQFSSGGGLEILISPDDPGESLRANWLPCPRGPFALILRAYRPARALVDGAYRLPPVERA